MPPEPAAQKVQRELAPLVERFAADGHDLFLVGGFVRDLILGKVEDAADLDLTTDARPDAIRAALEGWADGLWLQGERFGTIGAHRGKRRLEITTFRREVYRNASRKPEVTFSSSIDVDLSRRDFTINAMALRLPSLDLMDPFDGEGDLRRRVLRTPLAPAVSFDDDPLRMLRGARFAAGYELETADAVLEAMAARRDRLAIVSAERIGDEIMKLLALARPGVGVAVLAEVGLLAEVIPEADGVGSPATLVAAVDGSPPDAEARLALLCASAGAEGVRRRGRALRLPKVTQDRAARLADALRTVRDHRWEPSPESLRRLAAHIGADRSTLIELLAALESAGAVGPSERVGTVRSGWADLGEDDLSSLEVPLSGDDVMATLGIGPGPVIGRALHWLWEARLRDGPMDPAQWRARLVEWWATSRVHHDR